MGNLSPSHGHSWLANYLDRTLTRRGLIQRALAVSMATPLVAGLLAACEVDDDVIDDTGVAPDDDNDDEPVDDPGDDDPEPTPTPEPEPTPTPEPAATPTPEEDVPEEIAGEIDVQVRDYNYVVSEFGTLSVFGEIENYGDGHAEIREILITLRDDGGSVIASGSALYNVSVVEGGGTIPFLHRFIDTVDDFTEVQIEVEARPPEDAWIVIFENYREFDVLQVSWREGEFRNSIVGEIENVGEEAADFVQVFVAGYDVDGNIQFVETTFAERDLIRPGQTSPFTVDFLDSTITEPAEMRVWVEGWVSDD